MSTSGEKSIQPVRAVSGENLARMIFKAELPEEQVRALPPQSLYMAIRQNGLLSSSEIVRMASIEQCKLMLDFDLWHRDSFNEDSFWEWMALPDAEHDNDLALLQKTLRCLDLKLVGIILTRYVQVEIHEEATEASPGPGFHTPDRGHTWLHIQTDDPQKHFLLGRFLALIFETSAEIFYQLIAVPNIETPSSLEEQSFQEKSKRLSAEGVPDSDWAFSLNSPLPERVILEELKIGTMRPPVEDVQTVEPLIYQPAPLQPLSSLLLEAKSPDQVRAELTLLANAAIVHFHIDFCEATQVSDLVSRVRGCLNLGLEAVLAAQPATLKEIYDTLGLQKLYRLGLSKLAILRDVSRDVASRHSDLAIEDQVLASIVQNTSEPFPCLPMFFRPDGSIETQGGSVAAGTRPIETLKEYCSALEFLKGKFD